MQHPFISIIGNVATGKSTLASFLSSALGAHLIKVDELYKSNPFFKEESPAYRSRWSLASDLWFLVKRVEIAKYIDELLKKEIVVQDSGLLMSFVYANSRLAEGHINQYELDLYNSLSTQITKDTPKEDLIIFLDLPVTVLKKRISARGRNFEITQYNDAYLTNLDASLHKLVDQLTTDKRVIVHLDQNNWCDIIKNPQDQKRLINEVHHRLNL